MNDPTDISQAQQAYNAAHVLADDARAQIAAARQVATDATASLESATAAFRAKPTSASATAKMVAEQLASNAREALEQVKSDTQPAIDAESMAGMRVTYAERYAEYLTYRPDIDRDVAIIVDCEAKIRAAAERMVERGKAQKLCQQSLAATAGALNLPISGSALIEPQYLQAQVCKALQEKYGMTAINFGQVQTVSNWLAFY